MFIEVTILKNYDYNADEQRNTKTIINIDSVERFVPTSYGHVKILFRRSQSKEIQIVESIEEIKKLLKKVDSNKNYYCNRFDLIDLEEN